jgi:hypothetical protein
MTRTIFITAALALAVTLPAMPAQATGAARTFVSAAGSDSNNCINVATPCRHLATAFAATGADGEIYVLDPANYGSLTITQGVSIEGHGWASIAPVVNSAAITINANPSDKINIIGVVLDGTAVTNTSGIQFNSGGSLTVRDSVIRNFSNSGINFVASSSSATQIFVSNTLVSDNAGDGIVISPTGSGATTGALHRVEIEKNGSHGLALNPTPSLNMTVSDSLIDNNALNGILAVSSIGAPLNVMVRNSTIINNGAIGLAAGSTGTTIRVTRSTITGNGTGWSTGGGAVLSYADNNIDTNGSGNTAPPTTGLVYK